MHVDKLIELDVNAVNGNVFPYKDHYLLLGCDSYNRRYSYLQLMNDDFQLLGKRIFLTKRVEDHRLILNDGIYHVWCNYSGGVHMFCGQLDPASRAMDVNIVRAVNFTLNHREKNWCPLVKNGKIYVVYSLFPELVILRKTGQNAHERIFSERSSYLYNWVKKNIDLSLVKHLGGGSNYIEYRAFFIGTFHVKYHDCEYSSFMVFFTSNFVIKHIVAIDYGETLFQGQRLKRLKAELDQDEENVFFSGKYRQKLKKVAFTTGFFMKNDKFHISLGINDLVTKVAVIKKYKIDEIIDKITHCSAPGPSWESPVIT